MYMSQETEQPLTLVLEVVLVAKMEEEKMAEKVVLKALMKAVVKVVSKAWVKAVVKVVLKAWVKAV